MTQKSIVQKKNSSTTNLHKAQTFANPQMIFLKILDDE